MRGKGRHRTHISPRIVPGRGRNSSKRLWHSRKRTSPTPSGKPTTAPRKHSNIRPYVRLALFGFFCVLLAVSAGALILSAVQESNENSAFTELAAYVAGKVSAPPAAATKTVSTATPAPSAAGAGVVTTSNPVLEKYRDLQAINPDMVGWIKIDGTRIDYPVMYTPEDGDFYLHHDFQGKTSRSGVPFIDKRCSVDQPGANTIIYGHNMKNGSMFGSLDEYRKEAYFREHPIIRYDTPDEQREYEVVAVFLSQVYKKSDDVFKFYNYLGTGKENEFDSFYGNIKSLSLYDTGVEAKFGDRLITLITCEYHKENGRLVVVARQAE